MPRSDRDSGAALRIGVVGCGDISRRYVQTLGRHGGVEVVACASRNPQRALALAAEFGLAAMSPDDLITGDDVDIVVNVTTPDAHFDISRRALAAGKHVYSEKPLALTIAEAAEMSRVAAGSGVKLGCAPATFLGPAVIAGRAAIDAGKIGEVLGGATAILYGGPDLWHPNPAPLFSDGAGPLFDMGVYHLTELVALLGPIAWVAAGSNRARPTRQVSTGPKAGAMFSVGVPTHVQALVGFAAGPSVSLHASFDVPKHSLPALELYGSTGTLSLPRPGSYVGPVRILQSGRPPRELSLARWSEDDWCVGVLDLAESIRMDRPPLASAELALHILEAMRAIEQAAVGRTVVTVTSRCERPDFGRHPIAGLMV